MIRFRDMVWWENITDVETVQFWVGGIAVVCGFIAAIGASLDFFVLRRRINALREGRAKPWFWFRRGGESTERVEVVKHSVERIAIICIFISAIGGSISYFVLNPRVSTLQKKEQDAAAKTIKELQGEIGIARTNEIVAATEREQIREQLDRERNKVARLEEDAKPRRFLGVPKERFIEFLRARGPRRCDLDSIGGNVEAQELAADIYDAIRTAGWEVESRGFGMTAFSRPKYGIVVYIDKERRVSETTRIMETALKQAGFLLQPFPDKDLLPDACKIVVAGKPVTT